MTMSTLKKPAAAAVLLALAASTALRVHSWLRSNASMETTLNGGGTDYPPDFNRRLSHERSAVKSDDPLYDAAYRMMLKRGHEPGTGAFNRRLGRKVMRQRRWMLEQEKRTDVMQSLKDNKQIWIRGKYYSTRGKVESNKKHRGEEVEEAKALAEAADALKEQQKLDAQYEPLTVCDRPADVGSTEDFASLQKYAQCPEITPDKPILILEKMQSFGRTGNNLVEFLHAIQEARDKDIQLGVMAFSWATELILKMWMAIESPDWISEFEKAFCVKIFHAPADLEGWNVTHQTTKELFYYQSGIRLGEYMESQEYQIRTLFRSYNTGEEEGHDRSAHRWVNRGSGVKDMCSGIDAVFGEDRKSAIYSVIHSRTLEGAPGLRILGHTSARSGCDPVAALEMRPDYVKSILEPLGMLDYPIVLITDGQNNEVLERLMADPEIGPLIRAVPEEACWIGGDLTLAVMSNVFIGNPASSFTGFIAKSRLALGFGHNYLFRAKDENGEWKTVCGDHCIFDKSIMGLMA